MKLKNKNGFQNLVNEPRSYIPYLTLYIGMKYLNLSRASMCIAIKTLAKSMLPPFVSNIGYRSQATSKGTSLTGTNVAHQFFKVPCVNLAATAEGVILPASEGKISYAHTRAKAGWQNLVNATGSEPVRYSLPMRVQSLFERAGGNPAPAALSV